MRKKNFAVMLLICTWPAGSAFAVVYGSGCYQSEGYSESTAWEINSAAVLAKFRDDVNAGKLQYAFYVKLTNDIDLTGPAYRKWEPIGLNPNANSIYINPVNPGSERGVFRGHFDGNGHTIKVEISKMCQQQGTYGDPVEVFHGLFGIIVGGSIKNLNVVGNIEVFTISSYFNSCLGGIASSIFSGSIENCTFNGNLKASNQTSETWVGGIVGRAVSGGGFTKFSIKNCKVGSRSDTVITALVNTTNALKDRVEFARGIAGYLEDVTYRDNSSIVTGNYVRAEINGKNSGGLCGTRKNSTGLVYDNIEDDPSEPPPDTASLTITTASLPSVNSGENYSETLTATMTGGTWPITWAVTSGTLPTGLTLSADGTISGSTTAKGTYTFTVKASIGSSGLISNTKEYTITIADNQPSYSLTVKNASLSAGTVGTSYAETLKAELTGAELPASWSVSSGTLPPGLTLNTSGTITGTPTAAGTYTFTVGATFGAFTGTKSFTVTITEPTVSTIGVAISSANFPDSAFRAYVSSKFDTDKNGYLSASEISSAKEIDLWYGYNDSKVTSLKGIEHFTALTDLDCDRNQLTTLDVSKNTASTSLGCVVNQLTTLDVSKNIALTALSCYENQLTALDVSKNIALKRLTCSYNQLTTLDVSKNTA